MEIRKLDAFCKVVELKSFTRAAEAMLLTQPTVSEHVRSLENELGQQLVNRLGREVEATHAGSVLYAYARKIMRMRREAVQALTEFSSHLSGRIYVGCGTIPGTYILPGIIGEFREQYPSIQATLTISSSRIISQRVLAGELEFGVVGARWNQSGLSWCELFSDELTLAVPPAHPWALLKSISVHELPGEPYIMREQESGTRRVFAKILEENGLKESQLKEVAEIGTTAAVKEAVKAGIGVSILSRYAVRDDMACGRLAALSLKEHRMQRPFYLIRRNNRTLSPVASVFLKFLTEHSK